MRKAKLLAATLAAASIMSLAAPAFAEEAPASDSTVTETTMEAVEDNTASETAESTEEASAEEQTETSTASDEAVDSESAENSDDENVSADSADTEEVKNINDLGRDIISLGSYSSVKVETNAAGQTVYTCDYAKAWVNPDGESGRIDIYPKGVNRGNYYSTNREIDFTDPPCEDYYSFDNIGGVPLKDIIKFNDGGYISSFHGQVGGGYGVFGETIYDNGVEVTGQGPVENGSGHLFFTDGTGDQYRLSCSKHEEKSNTMYGYASEPDWHVNYNSDDPYIRTIEWYSYNYVPMNESYAFADKMSQSNGVKNEAGQTVYKSDYVTAYVNPDGISGYLDIDTSKAPTDTKWTIDSIGGTDLKDIVKFSDDGYVACFKFWKCTSDNLKVGAYGRGPKAFWGCGDLSYKDTAGRTETGKVYERARQWHVSEFSGKETRIQRIEWSC